jgi:hypothetical protein
MTLRIAVLGSSMAAAHVLLLEALVWSVLLLPSARAVTPYIGCNPGGYAMRFEVAYELPDSLGLDQGYAHPGYDSSDPKYRFPSDADARYANQIPGGLATPVYSNANGNTLYLASTHIANDDLQYQICLNIGAVVNLGQKEMFHEDKYPHWSPWPSYLSRLKLLIGPGPGPNYPGQEVVDTRYTYDQVFTDLPSIRLPQQRWPSHFTALKTFIDTQLAAGKNVLLYDEEGSMGAAAVAIGYYMKTAGVTYQASYDRLVGMRPIVSDVLTAESPFGNYVTVLQAL